MFRRLGGKGWLSELINQWMNDGCDFRTSPATPGLLIIKFSGKSKPTMENVFILHYFPFPCRVIQSPLSAIIKSSPFPYHPKSVTLLNKHDLWLGSLLCEHALRAVLILLNKMLSIFHPPPPICLSCPWIQDGWVVSGIIPASSEERPGKIVC